MKFKLIIFLFICLPVLASSRLKSVAQHQQSRLPAIFVTIDDRFSDPKKTTITLREDFKVPYDGAVQYESTLTQQGKKLRSKIIKTTYDASPLKDGYYKSCSRIKRMPRKRAERMFAALIEVAARHSHIDEWYPMPHNSRIPRVTSWATDDPEKGFTLLSHSNNHMRDAQENCTAHRLLCEQNPTKRLKDKYEMYSNHERYAVQKKLLIDFELTEKWNSIVATEKHQAAIARAAALKLQKSNR